jgi:uncharacterized phage protein gp47/JayE
VSDEFEMQSKAEILNRLKQDLTGTVTDIEGSFTFDTLIANAAEFECAYAEMNLLREAVFIQSSWGTALTDKCAEHGVIRKQATKATVVLTITGQAGAFIPKGSLFETETGMQFYTIDDVSMTSDTVKIRVEAGIAGTIGNVEANTINKIPMSIPNITAVNNEEPAYDGFDEETDDDLRERALLHVRTPGTSGNVMHYKEWALAVEGVGDVEIIPLWNGNGTVKIVIINADKQPASEELIENVENYIEENRPIGATVTVTTPEIVPVNINVKILGESFNEQKIKDNIAEYFGTLSFKISEVSINRIGKAILDTADDIDYDADSLKINDGTENIPLTIEQIAVLGEVIISHD